VVAEARSLAKSNLRVYELNGVAFTSQLATGGINIAYAFYPIS